MTAYNEPELRPVIVRSAPDVNGHQWLTWIEWQYRCPTCDGWHDFACTGNLSQTFDQFADLASQVRNVALPTVDDEP